jgi:4-hydroxy-4-methyl-2-oxoglutarate aldolase
LSPANVYEHIPRAAEGLLRDLGELAVADAHEALDQAGLLDPSIRPLHRGRRACGQAVTCACRPGDNLAVHVGLEIARAGNILVVAATEATNVAFWGELTTLSAVGRELGGVVIDGYARDSSAIERLGLPVWAKGAHAQGAIKAGLAGVNVPVRCGGVDVNPGDVVLADDDGVLVVPLAQAHTTLRRARERRAREAKGAPLLREGLSTFEWLGLESLAPRSEWDPHTWTGA